MEELDMIKAFAELESVNVHLEMEDKPVAYWYSEELSKEYNPITDLALTFKAMVDYGVTVEANPLINGGLYYGVFIDRDGVYVGFETEQKGDIPKLVIECILKSKGLWK